MLKLGDVGAVLQQRAADMLAAGGRAEGAGGGDRSRRSWGWGHQVDGRAQEES